MQAASKRILTSKSSNCSMTSSQRDLPRKQETHSINYRISYINRWLLHKKNPTMVHSPSSAGSSADHHHPQHSQKERNRQAVNLNVKHPHVVSISSSEAQITYIGHCVDKWVTKSDARPYFNTHIVTSTTFLFSFFVAQHVACYKPGALAHS